MTVLHSQLNPRSADFQHNAAAMRGLVDDLRAHLERVAQGGGEAPRAKHTARGKLLPRDRVQMLLDPGTPFLEVAPLAALTKGGPPKKMVPWFFTMMVSSLIAGTYAPPAVQLPMTTAICAMPCALILAWL